MGRFLGMLMAAAVGAVAALIFEEEFRRTGKSVAKAVLRTTSDGYQTVREDLEDLRAEVEAERAAEGRERARTAAT